MSNVTKKNLEVLKKTIAALTMTATVMSLAGFAAFLPSRASAAVPGDYGLTEGNTISAAGSDDPDVYIVNAQGYKRLFLNPVIFGFYGHLGGFANVKNVSATARDAFPTSGLFRNCETNDQKVYGVQTTGEDVGMLHWVNTSGAQAVADDPNFFSKVFCINNNEFNWYSKGSDYSSVKQVPNYVRTPGSTPLPSGPISVSLASDNPVSSTLVAGQAIADLAHFQFSGNGAVTSVTLKRTGVTSDSTLSSVYLYNGVSRLTDNSTVSSTLVNFNDPSGLFTVSGGLNVAVKANIATGTSGQTVGVQLVSYVAGGVTYTVSVSGNVHTIATATMATVDFGSSTTPSAGTINPQNDYKMWENTVTVGTRYVWLKSVKFRQIGSVYATDLANFRLYVDGTMQGSAVASLDAKGYITFDLSGAPVKLDTGGRVIKLLGDIVNGSGRTFSFSLQQSSDILAVDNELSQPVLSTANGSTFSARTNGTQTIGVGTITFTKRSDSPSADIVSGQSGVVLARYDVKAAGEKIKVEKLRVSVTSSTTQTAFTLRNGALFWNGVQIGSTQALSGDADATLAYTEYTFGSSMVVDPLAPGILEVRADAFDNDGSNGVASQSTSAAQTLKANIVFASGYANAQLLTSLSYIDAPTSTTTVGNPLTVGLGSLTLAKYTAYANQNVTIPNSAVKLGEFVLTGNSTEDVNVSTINAAFTAGDQFAVTALSDVKLRVIRADGSTVLETSSKSTVTAASNSYSVNLNLPKGQSYRIQVWAAVSSFTVAGANDTMQTDIDVAGTTVQSATSVTAHIASNGAGQTLTAATGSIASAIGGGTPSARIVTGGSQASALALDFTATNDAFTLFQLDFDMACAPGGSACTIPGNNPQAVVSNVVLKDGATILGSLPLNGASVSFTGLNVAVPQNGVKTLTAELQFGSVGVGAASSAFDAKLSLDRFRARDSNGTETNNATERNGNSLYVHKSYPSIAAVALPTTVLNDGQQTVSKFTVTANGDTVGLKKFVWTITKAAAATIASTSQTNFVLLEDGVNVQADGTFASFHDTQAAATISFVFTTEKQVAVGSPKTYELKLNLGATAAATSFVTKLDTNSSSAVNAATYAQAAALSAELVWSDRSGGPTTAHSESTIDWFNDNLVNSATSQALTR